MQNNEKKILELKFCKPGRGGGGGVFSNKLKMACARNLKALILLRAGHEYIQ
jgi:hypothetical protein